MAELEKHQESADTLGLMLLKIKKKKKIIEEL